MACFEIVWRAGILMPRTFKRYSPSLTLSVGSAQESPIAAIWIIGLAYGGSASPTARFTL